MIIPILSPIHYIPFVIIRILSSKDYILFLIIPIPFVKKTRDYLRIMVEKTTILVGKMTEMIGFRAIRGLSMEKAVERRTFP